MNKNFQKAERAVEELEFQGKRLLNRVNEAEGNVAGFRVALQDVKKEIAAALAEESSEAELAKLKKTQDKIKGELEMAEMLIPGLTKKISENEGLLKSAREDRDALFCSLAGKWLAKEKKAFDDASLKLSEKTRRLLACFRHLRDLGKNEMYYEVVGEAYKYLPATRILRLDDFSSSKFIANTSIRPAPETISQVYEEITI